MAVVRNLLIRGGADFSGMRKSMSRAQRDLGNFKRGVSNTMRSIGAIIAATGLTLGIRAATKEAMEFEASLQQINRLMGSSAGHFRQWANEQSSAFGMARSEAMKYGAVYANLLSGFSNGTEDTMNRTRDLLQASAVVSSSTGRTMEDVMERIRSGLLGNTEAIEDLGINVNIALIQSTQAFRDFAGDKSWQQLDFNTQQTIRYFAILEQAATKYGLEIAQNTTSRQAAFTAQLKNAQLALGQAFLPIYNTVLPALTRMATALANTMQYLAAFSQALFGSSTSNQTKATEEQAQAVGDLGDAYDEAGKKAKGAVAGFDQVNLIGQSSGASGEVAAPVMGDTETGEGGPMQAVADSMNNVSEKAKEMADKVRTAFSNISSFVSEHSDIIIAALVGVATAYTAMWIAANGGAIAKTAIASLSSLMAFSNPMFLIATAIGAVVAAAVLLWQRWDELDTKWKILASVLLGSAGLIVAVGKNFEWLSDNVLKPIGEFLTGAFSTAWRNIEPVINTLWHNVMVPFGTWLASAFVTSFQVVGNIILWLWNNVFVPFGSFLKWAWENVIIPLANVLSDVLGVSFEFIADVALSLWENVLVPLGDFLVETFGPAVEAISAVLTFLWKKVFQPLIEVVRQLWNYALKPLAIFLIKTLKVAFEGIIDVVQWLWKNALKPMATYVGGSFLNVFDRVFGTIGDVIEGAKRTFKGLMNFITGVFTGDWERAWEGIKDIFGGVFDSLWGLVKFPLNLIIDGINAVIGAMNSLSIDIPDWVPFFGGETWGINIPKIPKLAKGGLAYGPTLAVVGDNPNASVDPEVIAPLSKLEGMNDNSEVVSVLKMILQAVKDSGNSSQVTLSKTALGRAATSAINDISRRSGVTPLKI